MDVFVKKWKENLDGLVALEYIHFLNVPMKDSKHGPIVDLSPEVLDRLAAKAVIVERVPLRGQEVQFLRKVIGLSLERFANKIGLSSGTVFHWEKASKERLAPVNEAAVRSLLAEELELEISGKFSQLLGVKSHRIDVKAS
jgi:DNA-binding transcriptional regulator YiaG